MHTDRFLGKGDAETRGTLKLMRDLVYDSALDPLVIWTARHIVEDVNGHDRFAQAQAVREWLGSHLRFVRDPTNIEQLATPRFHLEQIHDDGFVQGDCDDAATLGAALANAIGLHGRIEAVAFGGPFQHVYTVLYTERGDVDLDTTREAAQVPLEVTKTVALEF